MNERKRLICVLFILVSILAGCNMVQQNVTKPLPGKELNQGVFEDVVDVNEVKYPYSLFVLGVVFNNKKNESIVASTLLNSTTNTEFMNFFIYEVNKMVRDSTCDVNRLIWSLDTNYVAIYFNYTSDTSDEEKNDTLNANKKQLEEKWYTEHVQFSYKGDFASSETTASIRGIVKPIEAGVRVRLIQNLSFVSETTTKFDGSYSFYNMPKGTYGLLFLKNNKTYIYNDLTNNGWNIGNININELVEPSNDNYDFNFGEENQDYISDKFSVVFENNATEDYIGEVIESYNLSLIRRFEWAHGIVSYEVRIPANKTVFEIMAQLNPLSYVKRTELDVIIPLV